MSSIQTWLAPVVCGIISLCILIFAENKQKVVNTSESGSDEKQQRKTKRKLFSGPGLLCIASIIIVALYIVLPLLARAREHGHYPTIENNLKQWGLVLKMYANESPAELYPPLTQYDDFWVPDLYVLYPEYLTDPSIARDPDNCAGITTKLYEAAFYPDPLDLDKVTLLMAQNYVYPGWAVQHDSNMEVATHHRFEKDMHESKIITEDARLYWMRDGVERAFITDINNPQAGAIAQSTIPVMVARPRPEKPKRGSDVARWWFNLKKDYLGWKPTLLVPVLFLDGHVEKFRLDEAPDHIKALIELFPEPMWKDEESETENYIDERDKQDE